MRSIITGVLALTLTGGIASLSGCSSDDGRYRGSHNDRDSHLSDAELAGKRNTRISDIQDDGIRNGSARSYDERKASRAADEGDRDAARREVELRREREVGR